MTQICITGEKQFQTVICQQGDVKTEAETISAAVWK